MEGYKYYDTKEYAGRPRDMLYVLFRHGEPEEYGKTRAKLSKNGKDQINELSTYIVGLINKFAIQQNKSADIVFLSSKRPRTKESIDIVRNRIIKYKNEHEEHRWHDDDKPRILTTQSSYDKLLLTTSPLNKIFDLLEKEKMPFTSAYDQHFQMDEQTLKKLGIDSPENITRAYLQEFQRLRELANELGPGPTRIYIGATHETTLGALDYTLNDRRSTGQIQPPIGYAAYMVFRIEQEKLSYQLCNTEYYNQKKA